MIEVNDENEERVRYLAIALYTFDVKNNGIHWLPTATSH